MRAFLKTVTFLIFLLITAGTGSLSLAGSQTLSPKIVNGEAPDISTMPWIAAVYTEKPASSCTGFLISPRWVLTAAHCLSRKTSIKYRKVLIGARNVYSDSDFLSVDRVVIHPRYKPNTLGRFAPKNDIALLRLQSTVENIVPVPIPLRGRKDYPGIAKIAGYGKTCFGFKRPECDPVGELFQGKTRIIPRKNCNAIFPRKRNWQLICTKSIAPRHSTICYGDSGGPLIAPRGEGQRPIAIGVLSLFAVRGKFPCTKRDISGYTAIYPYKSWISRYLGQK